MVVGQAAGHRFRFLLRPQGDAKGSPFEIKAPISHIQSLNSFKGQDSTARASVPDGSDLPEEL